MNNGKKELCRFCLKIIRDENIDIIGNIISDMLDVLLIEMDLNIHGRSLMCCECQDGIKKCFNFKSVCISSEDSIVKYASGGSKLDLADFYLKNQLGRKSVHIPSGHKICRLCMRISGTTKCMNNTDELTALTNDILHKFIPEVNINAVKNPVICETCLLGIHNYSEFVTRCLDVEKKINRYCEARGVAKRQVKLYNVLQFIINEALECDINESAAPRETGKLDNDKSNIEINCKEPNTIECDIKKEEILLKSEDDDDSCKSINCNNETGLINGGQVHLPGTEQYNIHEDMICDRNRNNIDTEEKPTLPLPMMVKDEDTDENQLDFFTKHNGKERSKEKIVERSVTEHDIKNEEISIKSDVDMRDNHDEVVGEKTQKNMHCCQLCTFSSKSRKLFNRHLRIHTTPADVIVYKCDDCPFVSKFKVGLNIHNRRVHRYSLQHQEVKCKLCTYRTTCSDSMKNHELTHLPPSRRQRFKCSLCDFYCVEKQYFKEHLHIRNLNSKSPKYRRTPCSFKTLHRSNYRKHMLRHKSIPKAELFHCAHCPFKTKFKQILRCHLLKHRDKSEVQMYSCKERTFKTRYRQSIKEHKKYVHGDPPQIEKYKCEVCPFQFKKRGNLNTHLLSHKSFEEVSVYRCFHCSYQANYKSSLISHLQTHLDQSERTANFLCEVCGRDYKAKSTLKTHKNICHLQSGPFQTEMYKCEVCPFQSKRRGGFTKHLLSHKRFKEASIYRCSCCSYETKRKRDFLVHVETHFDQSERQKFKCEVCGREYANKSYLQMHDNFCHLQSDSSQIEMYKCELCPLQFKRRSYLRMHSISHKRFEEISVYKCFHCSYQSKYKGTLSRHLETHMDQLKRHKFQCEVCSREYVNKRNLRRHNKTCRLRSSNASQENRRKVKTTKR